MNEEAPVKKKRTWLWIVLGVFAFCVIVAIGGIVLMAAFVRQSVSIADMDASAAENEFDAVRAQFAGQQALIQIVDGRPQLIERTTEGTAPPIKTMHIVAWDDDEEKLVRVSVPFWLLRLQSGPIRLNSYADGWDDRRVNIRVDDIERHGPGLLLDANDPNEGRVIIWAE
jgi:hypothetical protein